MKRLVTQRWLYPLLGAGVGFTYYAFVGCSSGTCPITSSPVYSSLYGALIGVVAAWGNSTKPTA